MPCRPPPPRSRFTISDPSLPFRILSDFDGGRGDGYFEEQDDAFNKINGDGGNGGRYGFVLGGKQTCLHASH